MNAKSGGRAGYANSAKRNRDREYMRGRRVKHMTTEYTQKRALTATINKTQNKMKMSNETIASTKMHERTRRTKRRKRMRNADRRKRIHTF